MADISNNTKAGFNPCRLNLIIDSNNNMPMIVKINASGNMFMLAVKAAVRENSPNPADLCKKASYPSRETLWSVNNVAIHHFDNHVKA